MNRKGLSFFLLIFLPLLILIITITYTNSKKTSLPGSQKDNLTGLTVNPSPNLSSSSPLAKPQAKSDNTLGTQSAQEKPMDQKTFSAPPPMTIDPNKKYTAVLKTTGGDITIEFNAKQTPITVNNFIFLAKQNFYNNTIFHRVIKGFMIQGGDPKGDGTGGPGYKFNDEPFAGDYSRGTVAMANAGPDTNGSQFFIMHADNPLPKNYVIFGHVTAGLDVVDKIAEAPTTMSPSGENSQPANPVKITSVEVKEE